jgi:16S rRNA processing protein RimM
MTIDDCYSIGQIVKLHGFKGSVGVSLDVDNPDEYALMESLFVVIDNQLVPFFIESIQMKPNKKAVIKFEDVDSEDIAKRLLKKKMYLPLEVLPTLTGTDFYYHEIGGFTAFDSDQKEIGKIEAVLEGAAQDIFQIYQGKKESLIPVNDNWILDVNRADKTMTINVPEGLIDFYLNL